MIVHCIVLDKFIPPFIDFIQKHFDTKVHYFLFLHDEKYDYGLKPYPQNIWLTDFQNVEQLREFLMKADKLIVHGLWSEFFIDFLYRNAFLLKKVYWVMWGGDFYFPEKQSLNKKKVIKKIKHFVTYIKGDYELVQRWYGAKGKYHECFMYPSNLYKEYPLHPKRSSTLNIQVGNSADPTNNHFEVFKELEPYKNENIKIFVPLSYGDFNYANRVVETGRNIFGSKFVPLRDFLPFEKYLEFLSEIDIAIFAHNRQQAMGNIITLLGLGKKVYMKSNITPWQMFEELGVKVFDVENIELSLLDEKTKKKNIEKIKTYFSEENLKKQLDEIFMF